MQLCSPISHSCITRARCKSRVPSVCASTGFDPAGRRRVAANACPGFMTNSTYLRYHQLRLVATKAQNNGVKAENRTEFNPEHHADVHEGPSTDLGVIIDRFWKLALPYWMESEEKDSARLRLLGVVMLTLGCTGISVLFNFLNRDFFNALSDKDVERFTAQLIKWFCAVIVGVPVFVYRDYYQSKLALEWREWMTRDLTSKYFQHRTYYKIQSEFLVDNPDQRIAADIRAFTDTSVGLSVVVLNSVIDLVSFSEILYSIYPPLFVALVVYSIGGTLLSVQLGRPLVGLNFKQEAREADFRYGLVRLRENSESIAFYAGERSEARLLYDRLTALVTNYGELLIKSRNLQFFTSGYRYIIQVLPAAVVAPLYFQGSITFGVINQSLSAFNHILTDVSLIVYQFDTLAGFSAVIDRLGEFGEVVEDSAQQDSSKKRNVEGAAADMGIIRMKDIPMNGQEELLDLSHVALLTPDGNTHLVDDLCMQVHKGDSLLLMGPSGAGKTSLLRAIAGLWDKGSGTITRYRTHLEKTTDKPSNNGAQSDASSSSHMRSYDNGVHSEASSGGTSSGTSATVPQDLPPTVSVSHDIMFVPQRPYMVLGSLRDQLLYPTWADVGAPGGTSLRVPAPPPDAELEAVLSTVRLGEVWRRVKEMAGPSGSPLDYVVDWSSMLSLGEQQRLAFARILLTKPLLVLMDESTSALDTTNEAHLYGCLAEAGVTFISVGHRPTLLNFHSKVLYLSRQTSDSGIPQGASNWEISNAQEFKKNFTTIAL